MNLSLQIRFLSSVALLLSLLSLCAFADSENDILAAQGTGFYENEDFVQAKEVFQKLITLEPNNSNYHHLLGRCYGRIAENASWLKAMSMAKKTRKSFEKAVELDDNNIEALEDLMEYYNEAPGFLGGSKKKARDIKERLDKLAGQF
jgi:tetratricopeptide (TPR) repeat protein